MLETLLPPDIFTRLQAAALANFEDAESYLPLLLDGVLPRPRTRRRRGGKEPAPTLLRPVDRASQRGRVLAALLAHGHVEEAMRELGVTRVAIFSALDALRRYHGIGYTADGGAITIQLPEGTLWCARRRRGSTLSSAPSGL